MSRTVATDPATRAAALARAAEIGSKKAAAEFGVSPGTIRSWRSRSGQVTAPPSGVDKDQWRERKEQGAEDAWRSAQTALKRVSALLKAGDERKAKDAALTAAILLDKSNMLEKAAEAADDRQARLTAEQGERLVDVLRATFDAVGVLWQPAVQEVVAHVMRCATSGAPLEPGPSAEAARAAVESGFRIKLRAELREQRQPPREPLALPAGPPAHPDGEDAELVEEPEPMAAPVRRRVEVVDSSAVEIPESVNARLTRTGWRS